MKTVIEALSRVPIKTPQLIGILCGIAVFSITIAVVLYLLVKSGTLHRALREIQGLSPDESASQSSGDRLPGSQRPPELHDHLILAARTLPLRPAMPDAMQCTGVNVIPFSTKAHAKELLTASDGTALFHESSYDAFQRLWQWVDLSPSVMTYTPVPEQEPEKVERKMSVPASVPSPASMHWPDAVHPYVNVSSFAAWYEHAPPDVRHLCIQDEELGRYVGMLTLAGNRPHDLSIEISNVWLTPAFRKSSTTAGGATRSPHAQIAVYLTLCALFKCCYRRVTMHVATMNIAGRKFAEACGFQLEGIHRKHRIVRCTNHDTCCYALLNSDWLLVKTAWERRLNMKPVSPIPMEQKSLASTATAGTAASACATSAASADTAGAASDSSGSGSVRRRPKTHIFDKHIDPRPTWTEKGSPAPDAHREKKG